MVKDGNRKQYKAVYNRMNMPECNKTSLIEMEEYYYWDNVNLVCMKYYPEIIFSGDDVTDSDLRYIDEQLTAEQETDCRNYTSPY